MTESEFYNIISLDLKECTMKKKIATRNFIFISVLLVIALVFTIFKMPIAFSDYIFNGFARSYNLGLDFGNGISATFDVSKTDYYKGSEESMLEDTQKYIQKLVLQEYKDGKVEIVGDQIKITVPGDSLANTVVVGELEMKADSGETATTYVNGSHIKSVKYMMNGTNHGVYIEFNKAGKTAFEELTTKASEGGNSIYFYLNHNYEGGRQISGITEVMSDGVCYITLGSKADAKAYAKQIEHSTFGVNLSVDGDAVQVQSTFSTYQKVIVSVGSIMLLVGIILFFALKYKGLGLVMSLALMIGATLEVILLSLFDAFVLNMASLVAMWLGVMLMAVMIYNVVAKSQKEYYNGKKLPVSFKSGYKKSILLNVDLMVFAVVMSALLMLIGNGACFTFGFALLISSALAGLLGLLLIRGFMLMYLQINPSKGNLINFVKGENIDEI